MRVDYLLQDGLDIRALLGKIGIFINEEDNSFILGLLPDKLKKCFKAVKADASKKFRR